MKKSRTYEIDSIFKRTRKNCAIYHILTFKFHILLSTQSDNEELELEVETNLEELRSL
jgi:hypothetical protein